MAIIGNAGRSVGATGSANGHHQPPLSFLPSVGQEISQIAALARQQNIQVTVFRGAAANRDNLIKQEWRDVDILHVAAHAQPARREVSEAAILLAPDEDGGKPSKLTLEDILQLDLSADLVVLSGCSTAEGINLDGEGTLSLGWACLAAGAGSVVVSLWPVPDNVTAKLMADFYHYWLVRGVDSAEALRSAQKEMSKRRYGHDYRLFSAFIHLGDGLTEPKMVPWRTSNKAQAARP